MRGFSIVTTPFSTIMLSGKQIFFKISLKDVQLTEIVDAGAILSRTEQIQLEMVPKMLKYYSSVTLSRFLCQEKREKRKVLLCNN